MPGVGGSQSCLYPEGSLRRSPEQEELWRFTGGAEGFSQLIDGENLGFQVVSIVLYSVKLAL